MNISVKKKSGNFEDFETEKLKRSLRSSGASSRQVSIILKSLIPSIKDGTPTSRIFSLAFRQLKKLSSYYAVNYSLKKAIFDLGPSGFLFERFCAEIIKAHGYKVSIGQIKKGCCVKHEIDIIGTRADKTVYVECKFHNVPSRKNDIKTTLYIQARCLDLKANVNNRFDEFWLMSNTTFSADAITYAKCVGLKLVGINCKDGMDIQSIVNRYSLHPITSLQFLKAKHKKILLENQIVLAIHLLKKRDFLISIGMTPTEINKVFNEIKELKISHQKVGKHEN